MRKDTIASVLVAGPTASGKSALALEIAEITGGEIINTDSMQVYRDLRIITARPDDRDLRRAPHHLYGHIDGAENHSVGQWRENALCTLTEIRGRGRLPIFVGGTGLYFKTLESGLAVMPHVPAEVREAVRAGAEGVSTPQLHDRLARRDTATALNLRPSDRQRILRALEVLEATGTPLSAWQAAPHTPALIDPGRSLRLFLAPERSVLYAKIDARFRSMVADGALEEVAAVLDRRLDPALPVMRAHGVPWMARHLADELTLEEAIVGAQADTRHYARRQFTWFRHQAEGWSFVAPEGALDAAREALAGESRVSPAAS
jgi:tRNA dimethylallyltransferase